MLHDISTHQPFFGILDVSNFMIDREMSFLHRVGIRRVKNLRYMKIFQKERQRIII